MKDFSEFNSACQVRLSQDDMHILLWPATIDSHMSSPLSVCYFGKYNTNHIRNKINIAGLRVHGVHIIPCRGLYVHREWTHPSIVILHLIITPLISLINVPYTIIKGFILHQLYRYDAIIVGYPGHTDIAPAFILSRIIRKPMIFDPLIPLYDHMIHDRAMFPVHSPWAWGIKQFERFILRLPDAIMVHTHAEKQYYEETFHLPQSKVHVVHVGQERHPNVSYPPRMESFHVVYVGRFIPLHGVVYVMQAAELLRDTTAISFTFAGDGQDYHKAVMYAKSKKLTNVHFRGWVSDHDRDAILRSADLVLGIFRQSAEAHRAIANKIVEGISYGKVVITEDSDAIREVCTHGKNIYLCKSADARSLADGIKTLHENPSLCENIAQEGYAVYERMFTPKKIGEEILRVIASVRK